jgi:hypothetical protein
VSTKVFIYRSVSGDKEVDERKKLFVCKLCWDNIRPKGSEGNRKSKLPNNAACLGFDVGEIPVELQDLNVYETVLIQRVKHFVSVVSLKTRSSNCVGRKAVRAMKGMGIMLPLDVSETQQ